MTFRMRMISSKFVPMMCFISLFFILFFAPSSSASIVRFQPFQNEDLHEFGLDDEGNHHCMVLRFGAKLLNLNLRNSQGEETLDFTTEPVKLVGFCSLRNEVQKHAQIQASWRVGQRRKTLKWVFRERIMRRSSAHSEELRWQLDEVEFTEKFKGRSVRFVGGPNVSATVNAPLNQKFVCRDAINLTLRHSRYKDIIVQLLPVDTNQQMELQPVATSSGLGNNVFICERTRRRTLRESFRSRMTIFSGILLGLGSVGMIIGYSAWKQMPAQQRREGEGQKEQYASLDY